MASRQRVEQGLHDQAVKDIARVRFTGDNWIRSEVYTNPNGEKNMGVPAGPRTIYPDLVITKKGTKTLTHVVEVETASSVTEDEATAQWRGYSALGVPFFLYVPVEWGATAKQIATRLKIAITHFREWGYENGQLKVTEI